MKKLLNKIAVLCAVLTAVQVTIVPYSARQELIAHAIDNSYIVIIPKSVTFNKNEEDENYSSTALVKVENYSNYTINVNLSSEELELTNTTEFPSASGSYNAKIPYTIKKDGVSLEKGGNVCSVNSKSSLETTTLTFSVQKEDIIYAGQYEGQLQFNVSAVS